MKSWHYKIKFVNMKKARDFDVPQCSCGKLARRHYEFVNDDSSEEAVVVKVVCEKCLDRFLNRR